MNPTTRRTFLKTSATLAAALPFARLPLNAAEPAARETAPVATNKGLLFDAADLPRIRANTRHPRFAQLWKEMTGADLADDTDFLEHKVRFNNHVADMMRCRQIVERSSFVYAVNGDAAHLAVTKLAIRKLLDYPKWDYFLEGGKTVMGLQRASEATIALAYALDCLRGTLTAAEVAAIEENIATKGAPACYTTLYGMKFPDRVKGWGFDPEDDYPQAFRVSLARWPLILNATNLKVIPTAALGIAAVLLHGRHPQAEQWLDLARSSAKAFSTMYGADGAYDEGASYWGYTTLHMAIFAETLWRRLGIDDRGLINYPGTIRYALAFAMPTKGEGFDPTHGPRNLAVPTIKVDPANDIVNFSDALTASDVAIASWVARTHRDPLSQHVAQNIGSMKSHFGLIWFDEAAPAAAPAPALLDARLSNDIVVSRTGWTAEDGVVALRSGGPANHEHADRNSVIFKAHGERLFHDPFRAGYSYTTPRWKLRLTTAHTALLINGSGHQYHDGHEGTNASWAWARVQSFRTGPGWMTVTSDATEAYALVLPEAQRVDRTVIFLKPDVLLLLDRVTLATAEPVQLRFQVFNDDDHGSCTAAANGFTITRPFANLRGTIHSAGAVTCATGRHDLPETEGVHHFVEAVSAAATGHELLTVATALPGNPAERGVPGTNTGPAAAGNGAGGAHGTLAVVRDATGWRVTGMHAGQKVNVTINTADTVPAITIA
ncbi:MAG: heparinase II/III family protein [Lacunisphaera sp.]|nr:heparinase II/III family protein [Lacunisphaera sp.]